MAEDVVVVVQGVGQVAVVDAAQVVAHHADRNARRDALLVVALDVVVTVLRVAGIVHQDAKDAQERVVQHAKVVVVINAPDSVVKITHLALQ